MVDNRCKKVVKFIVKKFLVHSFPIRPKPHLLTSIVQNPPLERITDSKMPCHAIFELRNIVVSRLTVSYGSCNPTPQSRRKTKKSIS